MKERKESVWRSSWCLEEIHTSFFPPLVWEYLTLFPTKGVIVSIDLADYILQGM